MLAKIHKEAFLEEKGCGSHGDLWEIFASEKEWCVLSGKIALRVEFWQQAHLRGVGRKQRCLFSQGDNEVNNLRVMLFSSGMMLCEVI